MTSRRHTGRSARASQLTAVIAGFSILALTLTASCIKERITEEKVEVTRNGVKFADVLETVRKSRNSGELVQRHYRLVAEPQDDVLLLAKLDEQGFVESASYRREGKKGKRYLELGPRSRDEASEDEGGGRRVLFSRGDDETVAMPDGVPIVLLQLAHRLQAKGAQEVLLLDIENAVLRRTRVDKTGKLVMPPAPPRPTPADPVLPSHSSEAPLLEAKTPAVVRWCGLQAKGARPVAAAKALALATKPKLSPERAGGPPSALNAVHIGGYDQAGAALVVACLRALEHAARVVTGMVSGATDPRSWAQVHDGARWVDVDPLDIGVNGEHQHQHTAHVEGFPGPLTTDLLTNSLPSPPASPQPAPAAAVKAP